MSLIASVLLLLAPAAAPAETPTYVPAGVADSAGSVVLVRTPENGLEAVEAATGRTLWKLPAPARPVLVARGSAFVLTGAGQQVEIARLEAATGRPLARWPLPAGTLSAGAIGEVSAGRESTRFQSFARLSGSTLEVEHVTTTTIAMGFPGEQPPPVRGVVAVTFGSDRVAVRAGGTLPRPALTEPAPAGAAALKLAGIHARPGDDALMRGAPPPDVRGVLVLGDLRVGFERLPESPWVRVHRWRAGKPVPGPGLQAGAATDAIWSTLDRAHLALRRAYEQPLVDVYALDSGRRIATLQRPLDISVLGGRALWTRYDGNDRIDLVATAGERELWRRTVWRSLPGPPSPPIP